MLPNGKVFEFKTKKEADSTAGSSPEELTSGGVPIESASADSIHGLSETVKKNSWIVTIYPSENNDEMNSYLHNKDHKVITGEEMKKKGLSQRGLGSQVPAHLSDSPFFDDNISQPSETVKRKQLDIINAANPAPNTFQTWIRKVEDIRTWNEVLNLDDEIEGQFVWGDFSRENAETTLKNGIITVYSSYPIENGVFVSTSLIQAQEYAGGHSFPLILHLAVIRLHFALPAQKFLFKASSCTSNSKVSGSGGR